MALPRTEREANSPIGGPRIANAVSSGDDPVIAAPTRNTACRFESTNTRFHESRVWGERSG